MVIIPRKSVILRSNFQWCAVMCNVTSSAVKYRSILGQHRTEYSARSATATQLRDESTVGCCLNAWLNVCVSGEKGKLRV